MATYELVPPWKEERSRIVSGKMLECGDSRTVISDGNNGVIAVVPIDWLITKIEVD